MNASQLISQCLHAFSAALAGFLIVHGAVSPSVASQVAQIAAGVVLVLGASAVHSLRIWVDGNPKLIGMRSIVDTIDTAIGDAHTTTQTTTTTTPVTGKPLFVEVATNHAAENGTK